jgi:hypothetical protein
MKRRFGFRRSVEMLPCFRRRLLTHNPAQIAQPQLLQWFFYHEFSALVFS